MMFKSYHRITVSSYPGMPGFSTNIGTAKTKKSLKNVMSLPSCLLLNTYVSYMLKNCMCVFVGCDILSFIVCENSGWKQKPKFFFSVIGSRYQTILQNILCYVSRWQWIPYWKYYLCEKILNLIIFYLYTDMKFVCTTLLTNTVKIAHLHFSSSFQSNIFLINCVHTHITIIIRTNMHD